MTAAPAPLAIALGDPAGIGPEVILGAWTRLRTERRAPPAFVVGGPAALRAAAEALGIDCPIVPIAEPGEALFAASAGLPVMAGLDAPWKVILYNDEVHTFDEVISQLVKATGCSTSRAEKLAWELHTKGKAAVYEGSFEECFEVQGVLREIQLVTEIEG